MKKNYESMNAMDYGTEVDFWEWYYRGKYKDNISFYSNDKKNWLEELKKHYKDLLKSKASSKKILITKGI